MYNNNDIVPKPLFKGVTPNEIDSELRNFKMSTFPLEDDIIDIWHRRDVSWEGGEDNVKKWLHSLYLVTRKGYYLYINDIFTLDGDLYHDVHPLPVYLKGLIDMTRIYMFARNSYSQILGFMLYNLRDGKINVFKTKEAGKYKFLFATPSYYSYVKCEK